MVLQIPESIKMALLIFFLATMLYLAIRLSLGHYLKWKKKQKGELEAKTTETHKTEEVPKPEERIL